MHYVISNLYGNMVSFEAMLSKIDFSENDHLYILGNVVGPFGIRIFREIMDMPNIHLIKGQMEQFILDWCEAKKINDLEYDWGWLEGTYELLDYLIMCKKRQSKFLTKLIMYLKNIPDYIDLIVNEKLFELRYNVGIREYVKATKILFDDGIPLASKY